MKSNKLLLGLASLLGLFGLLLISLIFGQHYVEGKIRVGLNRAIEKNADKYEMTYKNVKVSFLKRTVDVNDIEITPAGTDKTITTDRFQISEIDDATLLRMIVDPQKKTLPASLRISVKGIHITPDVMGPLAAKPLAEFGYDEINLSTSWAMKIDREAQTLAFNDVNLTIENFGKLSTTWQFSSAVLSPDEILGNPDLMKDHVAKSWKAVKLHMVEVRFTDDGILSHVDAQLKKSGKPSLAQSMQTAAAFAGAMGGRGPAKTQFLQDAIPKVTDFVSSKSGSIAIKAAPAKDMPLVELASPLALMDPNAFAPEIGLSVEVSH